MDGSSSDRATASDHSYWRSSHGPKQNRAASDGADDRKPEEKILDAAYNRLGEELGQRLDELAWPMSLGWLIPKMVKAMNKKGGSTTGNLGQAGADPVSRIHEIVTSMLQDDSFREAVFAEARETCRNDDEEALRRQVNVVLASRIAVELGLDGSRQISRDDPESLKQTLLVALVAGALNVDSIEDSNVVPSRPDERRVTL